MRSVDRLLAAARALPGDPAPSLRLGLLPDLAFARARAPASAPHPVENQPLLERELRLAVHDVLTQLSRWAEEALPVALTQASRAREQAGDVAPVNTVSVERMSRLRRRLDEALASTLPPVTALATLAIVTLRAAFGLVELLERRLASLIRLRIRSNAPELLPEGRPFLDAAPALAELAKGWA